MYEIYRLKVLLAASAKFNMPKIDLGLPNTASLIRLYCFATNWIERDFGSTEGVQVLKRIAT
jgi:hypothetical protein